MKVVTRFAPSPTGSPHVGGMRTALFSYLWAKHNGGKFLLRIEDTDRERLVPGAVEEIESAMKWMGLDFDDEIIYQSDRREIHKKYAEQLIKDGKAYKCFCTKERLEKLRAEQEKKKMPPGYDNHCRNLTASDVTKLEKEGKPYVIRLAMPKEGRVNWDDAVRGKMSIEYALSDDQVLMKSDGWPTYFLASVIDDHDAGVTDIIRGEEWIPSTPKNIYLYEILGWKVPKFAHMPVTLGPSGKKLSKRDGDTSVLDYQKKGYLPEALLNFLVFLGWNPKTEEEFFAKEELIKRFDVKDINKAPAVFDLKRLDWMNGHYIRNSKNDELKRQMMLLYLDARILRSKNFDRILEVEKSRLTTLEDITHDTDFYLKLPTYDPKLLIFKKSTPEATKTGLEKVLETLTYISLEKWPDMSVDDFNEILKKVTEDNNLTNGDVFWPIRVALSGSERSASPAELLWVFGKEESEKRIKTALEKM